MFSKSHFPSLALYLKMFLRLKHVCVCGMYAMRICADREKNVKNCQRNPSVKPVGYFKGYNKISNFAFNSTEKATYNRAAVEKCTQFFKY